MLKHRQELLGLGQRYLPFAWRARGLLDPLVHGVHARAGEVGLGVGQPLLIVRAGGLGQCQESLGLEVREQHATLPRWSGLDEELGQH